MKIVFRKCDVCKNVVWSFNDTNVACCDNTMRVLKANDVDASFEKHVPNYEIKDDKIEIVVNHVMEEKHYIMWIMMVCDNEIYYKEFKPSEEAKVVFDYKGSCKIYAYCNLHELWMSEVE